MDECLCGVCPLCIHFIAKSIQNIVSALIDKSAYIRPNPRLRFQIFRYHNNHFNVKGRSKIFFLEISTTNNFLEGKKLTFSKKIKRSIFFKNVNIFLFIYIFLIFIFSHLNIIKIEEIDCACLEYRKCITLGEIYVWI